MEAVTVEKVVTIPLTKADRCDECGAQAYYKVETLSGMLVFCAHHATKHEVAFISRGYKTWDYRYLLDEVDSPV